MRSVTQEATPQESDRKLLERSAQMQRVAEKALAAPNTSKDRGQELEDVLELAEMFPARHSETLDAPVFGR